MKTELIKKLERMIIVPKGELKAIVNEIEYKGIVLSDPKRIGQREKYYIVLNHLYLHHFHHQNQAKGSYNKGGAKYLPKELSNEYMRSKVGQIWNHIVQTLRDKFIIQRNEDFDSHKNKKPQKKGKKTDKSYSGSKNNTLGRPFAMCYRLAPKWQNDNYWKLQEISTANKLDPPNIRDSKGNLHQSHITIHVNNAVRELKKLTESRGWSPVIHKIYARKIALFNYIPFEDKACSTGRVFNKVNCLPSVLRKHIRISGSPMKELDIKSCLPNILFTYIEDPNEQNKWLEQIKNKSLYLFFAFHCGFITQERIEQCKGQKEKAQYIEDCVKKAKYAVCCYLGGQRSLDPKKVDNVIKNQFPVLHKKIQKIESSSPHKGELSRRLQKIESKICVQGMGEEPYTTISIHDGVGVAEEHLMEAYSRLLQLFLEEVKCECVITGFTPEKQTIN